MSEQSPFAPFEPQAETPAPEKPKRGHKPAQPPAVDIVNANDVVPRQRRKKATETKPTLKFDLQTILSAASQLNPDDLDVFQKIVGLLQDAGKPGRERLLAAIGKIFA